MIRCYQLIFSVLLSLAVVGCFSVGGTYEINIQQFVFSNPALYLDFKRMTRGSSSIGGSF